MANDYLLVLLLGGGVILFLFIIGLAMKYNLLKAAKTMFYQPRSYNKYAEILQFTTRHNLLQAPRVLIDNLHRTEKRKLRQETREFLKRTDPNWDNYSTLGKQRAVTEEANRRLNPRHISVQFKHDLKKEYDLINEQKRAGGMVRIPDLWREMKNAGYSRAEFERELFRLEKERIIEMQSASQPRFIPEHDRKLGIPLPQRGHLNYVVFRYDPRKPMRR